ncbi:MAG TPA: MFS transporter [Planctomycetota bacterium]|jgi:MFS family permease|nr:MFS transporter [Planctomycetota bacterium]
MAPTPEGGPRSSRNVPLLLLFNAFAYAYAYVPVSYFFYEERGYSLKGFADLRAVYYGSVVLAQLPTGLLADRLGRRPVLVLGPLAQALGALVIVSAHSFGQFALGEALLGIGQALLASAASAALFDSLKDLGRETDYFRVEASATVFRLLGTSAAFGLGGLIVDWLGTAAPYYATAIVMLGAVGTALALREPSSSRTGRGAATGAILRASVGSLAREPAVRWMAAYYAILFVWLRLAFYTYQPKLREVGEQDFRMIGMLFALLNVAAALVSRNASRIVARLGEGATLYGMQGVLLATFVFLGLSTSPLAFLVFFAQQAPFGLHFPVVFNATNRLVPSERRATVLSLQSLLGRLAFAAYFPLFGRFEASAGLGRAYLVSAGVGVAALAILALARPRRKAGEDPLATGS